MSKDKKSKLDIKKKNNLLFILLVIFLIAIITCISSFGLATWARYRTASNGNVTAQIANWSFRVNGESEEFAQIDLADTISYEHVENTKIAPGTQGLFNLIIDGSGSEVSIDYYIDIDVAQKPTNMKFYLDSNHSQSLTIATDKKIFLDGELLLTGTMQETRTIYWEWEYRTNTFPSQEVIDKYVGIIDGLQELVNEYNSDGKTAEEKETIALKINDKIDTKEAGGSVLLPIKVKGIQRNPEFAVKGVRITSQTASFYNVGDTVNLAVEFTENVYADSSKTAITETTAPVVTVGFNGTTIANNPVAKVATLVNTQLKISEGAQTATFVSVNENKINYTYTIQVRDKGTLKIENVTGKVYNQNGKELNLVEKSTPEVIGETIIAKTYSIGDSVPYSTTLNGVQLTNWKLFYQENDKSYLILDDYLPNSAISDEIRKTYNLLPNGNYSMYSTTNRIDLLNAMTTSSNWSNLLVGTMNGTSIDCSTTGTAMGSPDLELYVKAWNEQHPESLLYQTKNSTGYFVGNTPNPKTYYIQISKADLLFFPYTNLIDDSKCDGYWLVSLSANNNNFVMGIQHYYGYVNGDYYYVITRAFRPVVCLPSNILK